MSLTNPIPLQQPKEWQQDYVNSMISTESVLPIPQAIVDRDGQRIDTSHTRWVFPLGPSTSSYNWEIESPLLRYALMSFAINRIQRVSASAGFDVATDIPSLIRKCPSYEHLASAPDLAAFRETLTSVMIELARLLRQSQTYWRYWLPVAWFKWCATRVADLGFDLNFASRLASMRIPGGPKGAAVRSGDPLRGPLDHELERPLIQLALRSDNSTKPKHLQQKLAVALTLAFGRNPLSLRMMLEEDFKDIEGGDGITECRLSIPLIKKRLPPRTKFQTFIIGPELANIIRQVIAANRQRHPLPNSRENGNEPYLRPLFMSRNPRGIILETSDHRFALTLAGCEFNALLQGFVARHKIVSPVTGELLHITSRRMRYTFATDMVDMGLSKAELAVALGHSDTQNVRVYYDIGSRIVKHLEKAARGRIEPMLELFISSNTEGPESRHIEKPVQRLMPPLSCYLCPAFKPFIEARHDLVLSRLAECHCTEGDIGATNSDSDFKTVSTFIERVLNSLKKRGSDNA